MTTPIKAEALLPLELVFDGGHLTDIGIATLADGESMLVAAEVREHAHTCPRCAALLRDQALHSVALGELLRATSTEGAAASVAHQPDRQPIPWFTVGIGVALSMLGVILGSFGSTTTLLDRFRDTRGLVTALARAVRAALLADLPPSVTFATAALMVGFALFVMKKSPLVRSRA